MSILDTIKALFCNKTDLTENNTSTQITSSATKPEAKVAVKPASASITQLQIPEDSTLRRHFISNLKYEIESAMPARPTESTLKRHYDSTLQAKLENLLG